jgi:hypothetical protein
MLRTHDAWVIFGGMRRGETGVPDLTDSLKKSTLIHLRDPSKSDANAGNIFMFTIDEGYSFEHKE